MVQEKKNQKVDYSIMSDKKCKVCGQPLKLNVVKRNPHANLCYVCFKISKGKTEQVKRKYHSDGTITILKTINLIKLQKENIKRYGN
jgi:hypothetical protein